MEGARETLALRGQRGRPRRSCGPRPRAGQEPERLEGGALGLRSGRRAQGAGHRGGRGRACPHGTSSRGGGLGTCVSLRGLPWQSATDQTAATTEICSLTVLEPGGWCLLRPLSLAGREPPSPPPPILMWSPLCACVSWSPLLPRTQSRWTAARPDALISTSRPLRRRRL